MAEGRIDLHKARWTCSSFARWRLDDNTVGRSRSAFNKCRAMCGKSSRDRYTQLFTGWNGVVDLG